MATWKIQNVDKRNWSKRLEYHCELFGHLTTSRNRRRDESKRRQIWRESVFRDHRTAVSRILRGRISGDFPKSGWHVREYLDRKLTQVDWEPGRLSCPQPERHWHHSLHLRIRDIGSSISAVGRTFEHTQGIRQAPALLSVFRWRRCKSRDRTVWIVPCARWSSPDITHERSLSRWLAEWQSTKTLKARNRCALTHGNFVCCQMANESLRTREKLGCWKCFGVESIRLSQEFLFWQRKIQFS